MDLELAGRVAVVTGANKGIGLATTKALLSRSLAQEFGPRGIRVNCVSPGQVGTDLWLGADGVAQTVAKATGVDADAVRAQAAATLIAFLASERIANVTGVNYVIDGGLIKTT